MRIQDLPLERYKLISVICSGYETNAENLFNVPHPVLALYSVYNPSLCANPFSLLSTFCLFHLSVWNLTLLSHYPLSLKPWLSWLTSTLRSSNPSSLSTFTRSSIEFLFLFPLFSVLCYLSELNSTVPGGQYFRSSFNSSVKNER